MSIVKIYNVIGIMSGTSMDGIDCSYLKTNGASFVSIICESTYNYSIYYKKNLEKIIKDINTISKRERNQYIKNNERLVTNYFIKVIKKFIKENNIKKKQVDYIGFSGQTILHDPKNYVSIQLGSCKKIKKELGIKIIGDFRQKDISLGGEGAPIGSFYYKYILNKISKSSAIINLGGIANICYANKNSLIAFDVGPANLLIDDLMKINFKRNFDLNGKHAFKGIVNTKLINNFKNDIFFKKNYPKSLDREYFKRYFSYLEKLEKYNSICTASTMTVEAILLGIKLLNKKINTIILTGGGRKNEFIVNKLKKSLKSKKIKVKIIDQFNINGDLLEAQAFGYLAIRSLRKLTISLPTTTGVKKPLTGGRIYN